MKQRNWLISILAGLVLGLVFSFAGISNIFLSSTPVSAAPPVKDVLSLMTNSSARWSSANIKATTKWHTDTGAQIVNMSVQIQQPNQVKLKVVQLDENGKVILDFLWMTDGEKILEQNNLSKTYTTYAVPAFARAQPATPVSNPGVPAVIRHPIAMLMPSPLADYIYPTGLAQRTGAYSLKPDAQIQGRPTFLMDWNDSAEKYWIDQKTGMVLKAQTFTDNKPFEETDMTAIAIDTIFPGGTFKLQPPGNFTFVSLDDFHGH